MLSHEDASEAIDELTRDEVIIPFNGTQGTRGLVEQTGLDVVDQAR